LPTPHTESVPAFTPTQQRTLLTAHERLCVEYHCPIPYFHHLDPTSELVSSLLSHRTRNSDSGKAFKALRQKFPSWQAVRDAPTADVQAAIAAVTWPEQKAPRIQEVLRQLGERRGGDDGGNLSLDFLADIDESAARAWLEELPGVGPKTSAAVLSFSSLRRKALPVDSHHHRVAVRLGVIPASLAVGPSHRVMEAMLPPAWDAQQVYDPHEVLMLHGQKCCFYAAPACERCPVLDLCPFGRARLGRPSRPDAMPETPNPGGPGSEAGRASAAPHPGQAGLAKSVEPPPSSAVVRVRKRRTAARPADDHPGLFSDWT
jgi:endonuclease-3